MFLRCEGKGQGFDFAQPERWWVAGLTPDPALLERFRARLDALVSPNERLGLAVSGGPDSLALLLLAAAARPGGVEAATVDHALRPESAAEAAMVADVSERLGVPHTTLVIDWDEPPASAVQEQARELRYGALARWMDAARLSVLAAGHHLDDQAETLLMRLARGSGIRGLGGMRPSARLPGAPDLTLVRPLLAWRRSELEALCAQAGLSPADDPSNRDDRFERVRIRTAMASAGWLDPDGLARSAANLAAADEAIEWAVEQAWRGLVERAGEELTYRPTGEPGEIRRRIVARAVGELASEGSGEELRGRELDRLLGELEGGRTATLRGVRCSGGAEWRFARARPRR